MSGRDEVQEFVSAEEDTPPGFSRNGFTSPFGPLSAGKTIRLPMEIEDELLRRSGREGMSFGEYVRHVLTAHVVGADAARRMTAERLERVIGSGSDKHRE